MEAVLTHSKSPIFSKLKAWGLKPLVLDFYVQRVWPTFSLERILAKVTEVRPAAQNVVTIRLRPNFNFKTFQAGQHVLITTAVNGFRLTRTYSPTLLADGSLEITVKKIANGQVSGQLGSMELGATVEVSEPFGEMTWSQLPPSSKYVFCAGGVGITPLRSLIHAWTKSASAPAIELHYWAKSAAEFCFQKELSEIAERNPALKVYFYASDSRKVQIANVVPTNHYAVVVACGPESFVQAARSIAETRQQKFFGEFANASPVLDASAQVQEQFFEIEYDGKVLQASSQKTILESLEEQGFKPAYGCRMGICKSCTCLKTSGSTFSSRNQAVASELNEEIQICVTTPRSAVKLEKY